MSRGLKSVLFSALAMSAPLAAQPIAAPFRVNATTTGQQFIATAAAQPSGRFLVVWESVDQDGDGRDVYRRLFDGDGQPLSAEQRVNTYTTAHQKGPQVAAVGSGFVVGWL